MRKLLTTREVAKKLGISAAALSRYVSRKKVFEPETFEIGSLRVHSWSEEDVERLRKLLPKIANGRKTRWRRQREEQPALAGVPAPHEKRRTKKKK